MRYLYDKTVNIKITVLQNPIEMIITALCCHTVSTKMKLIES